MRIHVISRQELYQQFTTMLVYPKYYLRTQVVLVPVGFRCLYPVSPLVVSHYFAVTGLARLVSLGMHLVRVYIAVLVVN